MTYTTGGNIQATDYNTFVTLANGMNEIFGDIHPGATTLPNAGFGYGQVPVPAPVVIGQDVTAAQWSGLFTMMKSCGTHQGTIVEPPVPNINPVAGNTIVAENNPTLLSAKIAELGANKFNAAVGQIGLDVNPTSYPSASTWFTLLTFSFRVNFGAGVAGWNTARYFFNSGGSIQISGIYPGAVTPVQLAWQAGLAAMSPLLFKYNSTTPNTGSNDAPLDPIGFWKGNNPLTVSNQIIYSKALGGGYYSGSYVQVEARLTAAPGTNGEIEFLISLVDGDLTPDLKTFPITFFVNNGPSLAPVAFPGSITVTNLGFTYT